MIYVTYRNSYLGGRKVVKNIWNVDYEDVEQRYIEFMKEKALMEYEEECNRLPDEKDFPFGYDQWWGVRESILMP